MMRVTRSACHRSTHNTTAAANLPHHILPRHHPQMLPSKCPRIATTRSQRYFLQSSSTHPMHHHHPISRHFHHATILMRKKSKKIRPYAPNHPTRQSMDDALYNVRKVAQQHNVYHPDEIDFGGFIKSLPQPKYETDISQLIDSVELLELIPKKSDIAGKQGDGEASTSSPPPPDAQMGTSQNTSPSTQSTSPHTQSTSASIQSTSPHTQNHTPHTQSPTPHTQTPSILTKTNDNSQYTHHLAQWINTHNIPCNNINTIFRTFIHPNWLVHCFPEDVNIRNIINRVSNQKLSQKGSDILNFVLESYMTSHTEHNSNFLQHYEENRTKMTLLMYNDPMRFQDYMNRDLKETHQRLMTNEALAHAAKKFNLKSMLLSHFEIVEDHQVPEDDLLPRSDPEYMVFPASKRQVVQNHETILNANLLEALVGAIHLDSGMEAATRFIVDHIRPLLYEYIQVIDRMDYPRELSQLLKQFRSHVEYRSLKDPVNRGEVKVGVFIGTRHIDAAFGETFAIAKYRAAQKVYLDLRHNPVKIKQLEDSLVNQGYIQSMHYLKLQRIRDCMEFVPGAYQQVSRKQYKLNKNDINFYIQNK